MSTSQIELSSSMEESKTSCTVFTTSNVPTILNKSTTTTTTTTNLTMVPSVTGDGGMGRIYLGEVLDPKISKYGRVIAVKVPRGDHSSPIIRNSVFQEIAIMNMLNKEPNIAKLVGYCENPLSILMKYYQFGTLSEYLHTPDIPFSKVTVLGLTKDVSKAIRALHHNSIAHCDIKSSNFLMDVDKYNRLFCVLTDFGISQVIDSRIVTVKEMKIVNVDWFSVMYAAPEQIREMNSRSDKEKRVSSSVIPCRDIYALGSVVYEIIIRKIPWD